MILSLRITIIKVKEEIENRSKFEFKGSDFEGSFGKISLGTMMGNLNRYSSNLKAKYVFGKNN